MICSDYNTSPTNSPTVYRFIGTGWQTIGNASFSKTNGANPNLVLLNNRMLTTFSDGAFFAYKYDCASPVTVTRQPLNFVACAGGTASFTTTSTGATSYRWQTNSGLGWTNLSNGSLYSGIASDSLSLSGIPAAMSGKLFRCIFTNACSGTVIGDPVGLTIAPSVAPAVSITASPGLVLTPGQSVTFTASVTNGGQAPQYQWLLNGSLIAGATTPTFVTNTLVDGDAVSVRVTRSDTCTPVRTAISPALNVQVSSAVSHIQSQYGFKVFPQPVHDYATLTAAAGMAAGTYKISLHSVTGELVMESIITLTGAAWSHSLMLPTTISNGLYHLSIQGPTIVVRAPLMIER
jgi:hypothetical protein